MKRFNRLFQLIITMLHGLCYGARFQSKGRNYFSNGCLSIRPSGSMTMGEENIIERGYDIEVDGGRLTIGSRCYFNKNVKIVCFEKIEIGDDCLIADSVHFYDHDHQYSDVNRPIKAQGYIKRPIKVGNNVWIGAKATILKGVTISDGAIIGANAVVTKDVPANAIVAGNPAHIVKMRGHDK